MRGARTVEIYGGRARLYSFGELSSTNDELRNGGYDAPFDAVVAARQTRGRGRNGKCFVSNEGGLYMSVLLEDGKFGSYITPLANKDNACVNTPCAAGASAGISADYVTPLAGVAVADVLADYGLEAKIKWVNDVFVGGRKICGILAERFEKNGRTFVCLGVGINVNNTDFGEYGGIATSVVAQTAKKRDISETAEKFLARLSGLICEKDKKYVIDRYREKSLALGKTVILSGSGIAEGERVTALDIDADGGLVVKNSEGRLFTVNSGSISLAGKYGE